MLIFHISLENYACFFLFKKRIVESGHERVPGSLSTNRLNQFLVETGV